MSTFEIEDGGKELAPEVVLEEVSEGSACVIDMEELHGPNRSVIVKQIGHACRQYGFFRVKNHGISETNMNKIQGTAREFFKLPEQERLKFCNKSVRRLAPFKDPITSFFVLRDTIALKCYPIEDHVDEWPSSPPSLKKDVSEYSTSAKKVEFAMLEAISESLGLERDYIIKKYVCKPRQIFVMNSFPICKQQDVEFSRGIRPHADADIITVLLQDSVPGFNVLNNGKWVDVAPIPNTLLVHVGDLLQVISNYQYKSLFHQVFANSEKERISITSFCEPSSDTTIGPTTDLIDDDHPAIYKNFTYGEYLEEVWRYVIHPNSKALDAFKSSSVGPENIRPITQEELASKFDKQLGLRNKTSYKDV